MATTDFLIESYPFILNSDDMIRGMGEFGLRVAHSSEIEEMMALGEELLGEKLTRPEIVAQTHDITGLTAWVFGDPIEGLFILVPLSEAGLSAVCEGSFDPSGPDPLHLWSAGELCAGIYCGIYAGQTHAARKAVMTAAAVVRMKVFAPVPSFARAASEDGARSMKSLGWEPAGFGADQLWIHKTLQTPQRKVA